MLSAQNNPLTTGAGRVLTTCKLNDSLRDAYSCFVRCEMFFFLTDPLEYEQGRVL